MSIPCGPDPAHTLETLGAVQRQLAEAVSRLTDAARRAAGVADQTRWRTDAATVFHATAESWRHDVASLADSVESAREHVGRECARVQGQPWWWGA
jgi:hypothetical protein